MKPKIATALIAACSVITAAITPVITASASNGVILSTARVAVHTSSSSSSASLSSSRSSVSPKTAKVTCIQKAVRMREEAIRTSLREFTENMDGLLVERSGQLEKYWGLSDTKKRDSGLRAVWRSFGSAWRVLGLGMREDRRTAWEEFRKDKSDCGIPEDPEKGGLGADSQF